MKTISNDGFNYIDRFYIIIPDVMHRYWFNYKYQQFRPAMEGSFAHKHAHAHAHVHTQWVTFRLGFIPSPAPHCVHWSVWIGLLVAGQRVYLPPFVDS